MAENNLIHAGLPWTNPAKITIKSSEFINDVTINRGLLNLLNNDYYLDLKTEAINEYLETVIQNHINNNDIHFSWDDVKDLFDRIASLSANTGYRIPIRKPGTKGLMITTAEIMAIVNKIPRNLNGYTLIIELCVPLSAAEDTSNCKTSLDGDGTVTPGDTYNYDFKNRSLNIEDFFGGTLIIWANNQYFVDDVKNPTVFDDEMSYSDLSDTITYLQKHIINPENSANTSNIKQIPLLGNAINSRYSVLSLRNLLCDTYVYNMNITNTLTSTDNLPEIISGMEFPETNNVICMWPLEQDLNCKYQNTNIFNGINNPKFTSVVNDVKSPKTLFGIDSTDSGVISCAILNEKYLKEGNQPDHLMFDTTFNEESQKTISNSVRNILYETNNVTLMFWGKLFDYNTHSPILIDALPDDRTQGLYFYLDQMLKADPNNPDKAPYKSSHSDYFNNINNDPLSSYYNRWALYVMEFQHGAVPNNVHDRKPYNVSLFQNITNSGDMRINMTVYWNKDFNNPTGNNPTNSWLLYPNNTTYNSANTRTANENDLISAGFQFSMENSYADTNVLRFFANQIKGNHDKDTVNSITNFNFFSGCLRNMLMFDKILTTTEIKSIFSQGPSTTAYDWYDTGEYDVISGLGKNNYFGTIYAHNVKQLNLINNNLTQKMK